MKRKLTLTITQSRRQVTTLPAATTSRRRCPTCGREVVAMLNPAQAAEPLTIAGHSPEDLLASSHAHDIQTANDEPRVCKDSLFAE